MKYPHDHENDTIYFGRVNFRNRMQTFGIRTDDRRRHMYIIGKTGMGKTTLLENLFLSDVYAGHGACYIDPHGDTAEKLIDFIPAWRLQDVVYFNPSDLDHPMGFNILESVDPRMKHLVAAGLMGVFKKIWEGVWSARMEYIMNNTILALLDTPGTTLLGINRMLSDEKYRAEIITNVTDPIVKQFWLQEFANYQDKFASEAVAPIQNKVGQFLSAAVMRNIVAQAKSTFNIREMMDQQQIFVVNLAKGRVGEDASRLLGGMLITKIQMSAMERVDMPEAERQDFYLYVDEFQNFAVESFASILSEARKYRLNLIMAHQYIAQLTEEVRDAVFGNVGTIVSFRVGSPDAIFMEQEFTPRFTPEDIINLPKFQVYLKLMIDGVTSPPFSALTLPPIAHRTNSTERAIAHSREAHSIPREQIEKLVNEWSGFGADVDVSEMLEAAKQNKKDAKKKRFMHAYECTRCKKTFELPVELDRSRPIYCEECHPLARDEGKSGGGSSAGGGASKGAPSPARGWSSAQASKEKAQKPPAVKDGTPVEIPVKGEMSLSELSAPKPKPPVAKPAPREEDDDILADQRETPKQARSSDMMRTEVKKEVTETKSEVVRKEVVEAKQEVVKQPESSAPASKPEVKSEVRSEPKPYVPKPAPILTPKSESAPSQESKPAPSPVPESAPSPAPKPDLVSAPKPERKPEPVSKPEPKLESKPVPTPVAQSEPISSPQPETKFEEKPAPKPAPVRVASNSAGEGQSEAEGGEKKKRKRKRRRRKKKSEGENAAPQGWSSKSASSANPVNTKTASVSSESSNSESGSKLVPDSEPKPAPTPPQPESKPDKKPIPVDPGQVITFDE